jgi:hypothetical protein
LRAAVTAKRAASVKSKFSRATRLKASAGHGTRVGRVVAEVAAVVDAGATDVWQLFGAENLVERERHTVGRRAVHRPVALVNAADAQRAREGQAVRGAAHLGGRRDDVHVAQFAQSLLQLREAVGMYAVVVCQKNANHTIKPPDITP